MDLNRIRELAGLEVLKEFVDTKGDHGGEKDEGSGSSTGKAEVHVSKKGNGGFGDMIVIDGIKEVGVLAGLLGIPANWKLTKVGKLWAAFNQGDRLVFFTDQRDFQADDEDDEE